MGPALDPLLQLMQRHTDGLPTLMRWQLLRTHSVGDMPRINPEKFGRLHGANGDEGQALRINCHALDSKAARLDEQLAFRVRLLHVLRTRFALKTAMFL